MSTYTQILYQIVFGTRNREPVLIKASRPELFKYIHGILSNKKCHPYQINGVEDHLHIITHLHPTVALSDLVKDSKVASAGYIKDEKLFPHFKTWQEGYGAFTYHIGMKETLVNYVVNQEEHHRTRTFKEELENFLREHNVIYDEKYL